MKIAPFATSACALALLVSSPARASIPGNLEERSNDVLVHVCRDVEPGNPSYHVCEERDFTLFGGPYTGSECVPFGLAPSCAIDFIPGVRLTGKLTLIDDDQPVDRDNNPVSDPQSTLILDLTIASKQITYIESYQGTKIGNWNDFDESFLADPNGEIPFTNPEGDAFQFTSGNLFELGLKIRENAQTYFPAVDLSNAVPVLVSIARDPNKGPVDATDPSHLASAGYFKVVIRFARVQP